MRALREVGTCAQAVREMNQDQVHWNSFGETRLQSGETLLYSGKENEDDHHEAGVALLLSKGAAKSLIE